MMMPLGKENLGMVWDSSDVVQEMETNGMQLPMEKKVQIHDAIVVEGEHVMKRPKYPTSYWETLAHHLKGNVASGMYAMGDAFKNAGLLLAPFLTVFLGIFCVYNQHVLVNCANTMRKRNKLHYYPLYDDTVYLCFKGGPPLFRRYAKQARAAVRLFVITAHTGFCCIYLVFVTNTSHQILEYIGYEVEIHLNMLIVSVFIIISILIRNLKFLAPVSLFATVTIIGGLLLTLYISSFDLPPLSSRHAVASLSQLPLFIGTTIYAYEGIGMVLPLQVEMKNPESFDKPLGVLNVGNSIVTILLLAVGTIGYLKYGEDVAGSLALNLPEANLLSQCVKIAIAVGVLLTYPIMFYVPLSLIWPAVVKRWGPFKKPVLTEYGLRIGLCIITFMLAEVIPNLSLFISLIGAVCCTGLALVLPPLCDLSMRHNGDFGLFSWRKIVDYATLLLAAFSFFTGTYCSLLKIIDTYSS